MGLSAINRAFQQNREGSERREEGLDPFCKQETLLPRRPVGSSVSCSAFSPLLLVMQQEQKPADSSLPGHAHGRETTGLRSQEVAVISGHPLAWPVGSREADRATPIDR